MKEIETISWKEMTGNKYTLNLHPAMVSEHGYVRQKPIRRIGDTLPTMFNVIYDRDYLINFVVTKLCKPLFGLSKERVLELVSEAWDKYYGIDSNSSDTNRLAS